MVQKHILKFSETNCRFIYDLVLILLIFRRFCLIYFCLSFFFFFLLQMWYILLLEAWMSNISPLSPPQFFY